jgi:hypothetical protein
MSITTTLADIRAADPCSDGFAKIRDHLGVSPADAKENHEPFPVALLLETNDLGDTLWVLDNVIGNKRLCRLFAADCAESVLPIFERHRPDDDRPRHAISVGRDPNSTAAARAAAWDAAEAAARAASCAARDAAGDRRRGRRMGRIMRRKGRRRGRRRGRRMGRIMRRIMRRKGRRRGRRRGRRMGRLYRPFLPVSGARRSRRRHAVVCRVGASMTALFRPQTTITAARLGLAVTPETTCACCGEEMPEAEDRAANWTDLDGVTEAQAHYRGPICVRCFEDFATCAHCGNKRREQDMWSYTGPVCSSVCDLSLEYDNTNADNRLTWSDVR